MQDPIGGLYGGTSSAPMSYANQEQMKMAQMPTMKQRIELAVTQAEEKLAAVKRAREIFNAHPELEELLNIMQRMHF